MTTNALIERKEERDDDEPVTDGPDEESTADEEKTLDEIIDTYAN
ncbi:MAG: hypothetical protein SVG88_00140 [Halobacteriales archaeon]|nr:hypothetical protein [Halobacteriales archaeon]